MGTISTHRLEDIICLLKSQQHRESTRKNYYAVWKQFNKFFLRLDVKLLNWNYRLVLFTGFLIDSGKKSTTIRSYLSAIRAILRIDGFKLNEDTYLINALTRTCKLKNDRVTARLPIGKKMLEVLLWKIPILWPDQPYLIDLYRALFLTTYHGLFRIGEVTQSPHVIKAKDVYIGKNKRKLRFVLHSSKTHDLGDHPQVVKITSESIDKTSNPLTIRHSCPFAAMNAYRNI